MAAVVAPIRVNHPQLRDGRVAVLGIAEIIAHEAQVLIRHREAHFLEIRVHLLVVPACKAGNRLDGRGGFHAQVEAFGFFHGGFAALHGVNQILFDMRKRFFGDSALYCHDLRRDDLRALALGQKLRALGGAVGALVVLPGQVFHRERLPAV